MGACLYVFPNEFRKRRVQGEKWRRQDRLDPALSLAEEERRIDPAAEATGNIYVVGRIRSADRGLSKSGAGSSAKPGQEALAEDLRRR